MLMVSSDRRFMQQADEILSQALIATAQVVSEATTPCWRFQRIIRRIGGLSDALGIAQAIDFNFYAERRFSLVAVF